jgi:hypothetical protein
MRTPALLFAALIVPALALAGDPPGKAKGPALDYAAVASAFAATRDDATLTTVRRQEALAAFVREHHGRRARAAGTVRDVSRQSFQSGETLWCVTLQLGDPQSTATVYCADAEGARLKKLARGARATLEGELAFCLCALGPKPPPHEQKCAGVHANGVYGSEPWLLRARLIP